MKLRNAGFDPKEHQPHAPLGEASELGTANEGTTISSSNVVTRWPLSASVAPMTALFFYCETHWN